MSKPRRPKPIPGRGAKIRRSQLMVEIASNQGRMEEAYSELAGRGLIDARGPYPGHNAARDAVARALTKAEDWLNLLPLVLPLPMGWRYSPIAPRELLGHFLSKKREGRPRIEGGETGERTVTVVDGDLYADIREIWQRREWGWRSRLVVRGDFFVSYCNTVQSLDISCLGSFAIRECPRLKSLRGEAFGYAVIESSGIEGLGADFRCGGELTLKGCQDLRKINCEVAGDFTARDCGVRSTGPAFAVGGKADFLSCPELESLAGIIDGKGRIERSLQMDVDCSRLLVRGVEGENSLSPRRKVVT